MLTRVAGLTCVAGLMMVPAHAGASVGQQDSAGATDAVAVTDRGLVRGNVADDHRSFAAIPYAAAPLGEFRWKAPQPMLPWPGVRDARTPGPRCAQPADPSVGTPASSAEDCLYLNVTAPRGPSPRGPHGLRPVAVWVHGGGFRTGAGHDNEPVRMAVRGDVVVVTVNYRLGALGFFGHPGLRDSGSFGLQDQQAALRWVRRNAAFFGGDPANVTVFGESAGGDSMCALLASPEAAGLFDRAVAQSGTCTRTNVTNMIIPGGAPERGATWKPRAALDRLGAEVADRLGCARHEPPAVMSCLRDVPVTRLLAATDAQGQAPYWSPAVGSRTLPRHPAEAVESGHFNRVPVLEGTTKDEGTLFAAAVEAALGTPMTPQAYRDLLVAAFGEQAGRVEAHYPIDGAASPGGRWAEIITDRAYACPNLDSHRVLSRRVPTYSYEFADRHAPPFFDVDPSFPMGAYHGAEVAYLLDPVGKPVDFDPAQRALADRLIDYWTQFMATGNPNVPGAPAWPRVDPDAPHVSSLAPGPHGIRPVDLGTTHQCDLWADVED